ncbi:zinc ribbon domain-containing protein [Ligilactobacillus murinus]|uniref:zinc ribbon domain-containing protein n=1 Tax=Ligilactobacillus murinus TaxID=1622 RepID=UPI00296B47FA|nr:zinc ribbon domain-containing protein [Ligilactobacillus murinus]WOY88881.1 zinc ribbon domain-containing protein [Ligilactobacillus murinus]
MQCPNCGNNNAPGAKFCQNCGYNFSTGKKKGPWLYILLVVGALVVLCGGFFAYKAVTNQTASAPTKQVASSEKETSSSKVKKKESSSEKESSTAVESSSEREKASSTSVETASSSSQEASSAPASTGIVAGQTTAWSTNPNGNGDEELLVIQGTNSVSMSHNTASPSGTMMHNDGTFTIENVSAGGTRFFVMDREIVLGEVTISGNTLTLNQQGQVRTYYLKHQS